MVVNRRKKVTKYRSHTTHGGGHRKKRRGAGSRGGRGNAGSGKRAGQKVAGLKNHKLGRSGFNAHSRTKIKAINLSYFTPEKLEKLVATGKASKEGDLYVVDFKKLGFNKLLGAGVIKSKLRVSVTHLSKIAEEKIKNAGGIVEGVAQEAAQEAVPEASAEE